MELRQVTVACGSEEEAATIAGALVERRLAACAQVLGPMTSTYRWQGRIQSATEWLLLAKTTEGEVDALAAAVAELHTYEVPEVVATPITGGLAAYLDWLAAETSAPAGDGPER